MHFALREPQLALQQSVLLKLSPRISTAPMHSCLTATNKISIGTMLSTGVKLLTNLPQIVSKCSTVKRIWVCCAEGAGAVVRTEALSALTGIAKNYDACLKPLWAPLSQAVAHNLQRGKQPVPASCTASPSESLSPCCPLHYVKARCRHI